eukprot:5530466-Prymnesium_polylepis.1
MFELGRRLGALCAYDVVIVVGSGSVACRVLRANVSDARSATRQRPTHGHGALRASVRDAERYAPRCPGHLPLSDSRPYLHVAHL